MSVKLASSTDLEANQKISAASDAASDLMAIYSRNFSAFLKAQKIMMDGNKSLIEHQIECIRSTMEQTMKLAQDIISEPDMKASLKKRCESILSEVNARFNGQAAEAIQTRIFESIDEMEAILEKVMDGYSLFIQPISLIKDHSAKPQNGQS
jgi:transcriptional regulator of heat shock response